MMAFKPTAEQLMEWLEEFESEPKALADVLCLPEREQYAKNGRILEVEVANVAAAISGMVDMTQCIYNKVGPNLFEIVDSPAGQQANLKKAFLRHTGTEDEKRDDFWCLLRTKNCTSLTCILIATLSRLADLGVRLLHQGAAVKNFGMLDGLIDLNECRGTQKIQLKIGTSRKAKVIGIHGTHSQHEVIRSLPRGDRKRYFPWSVSGLQDRDLSIERAHRREAQALGLKDENEIIVHYWTMLLLENGDTVHIDLCGPTYGTFEYKVYDGSEVPVSVRTVRADSFQLFPKLTGFVTESSFTSASEYLVYCRKDTVADDIPDWVGFSLLRKCVLSFNLATVPMVLGHYRHVWTSLSDVADRSVRACRAAVGNCVRAMGTGVVPRLRGVEGVVQKATCEDEEEERWKVLFQGEKEVVRIKPKNLRLGLSQEEKVAQYSCAWKFSIGQ